MAEYVTVAEIQDEYGEDVADLSDATIQRRIDLMSAALEDELGHGFGRTLIASSSATDTVEVTSSELVIGGDTYSFADYSTLLSLTTAVNAANKDYSLELLPHVFEGTPSDYLNTLGTIAIGPDYSDRQVLCLAHRYEQHDGKYTSHVFLDLPLASVTSVVESGTTLTSASYWAIPGTHWLVRKCCSCISPVKCRHVTGRWKADWPGNVLVKYIPFSWGRVPKAIKLMLLDAFGLRYGLGHDEGVISERFGPAQYSYTRAAAAAAETWRTRLGSHAVRQYAIRVTVP